MCGQTIAKFGLHEVDYGNGCEPQSTIVVFPNFIFGFFFDFYHFKIDNNCIKEIITHFNFPSRLRSLDFKCVNYSILKVRQSYFQNNVQNYIHLTFTNLGRIYISYSYLLISKSHLQCRNPTLAKCGGEAQHLEKVRSWSPLGLPNVQSSTARPKTPRIEVFLVSLERS